MKLATYLESKQSIKTAGTIIRKGRTLGCILYLAGLVYLVMLPHESLNRSNFFDENALMAGLVKREFTDLTSIKHYAAKLRNVAHDERSFMELLEVEFAGLGLEVYSQNFTATKPLTVYSEDHIVRGRNVYAIMRAGRAKSTESIVLSAPYLSKMDVSNAYGVAIMLSLAKYFRVKNYWAKDLIFLVTCGEEVGMQAWVDQYMGLTTVPTKRHFGISSSNLPGRSGAIQAVINLEIPSPAIKYVNVIMEGTNGILPNLDLVNVMVYLCHAEEIKSAFHDQWEWLPPSLLLDSQHHHALYTMLAMMMHQAPGLPQGGHAHFLQHRVDSVTVRGVENPMRSRDTGQMRALVSMARALEGTFRSVNNLLETLHHSEFFYFMAATWKFISIGLYMPLLIFLLAPLILEALSQWLQARNPHLLSTSTASMPTVPCLPFPFHSVMKLVVVSYGSGLLLYCAVLLSCHLAFPMNLQALLFTLLLSSGPILLTPLILRMEADSHVWRMNKCFVIIFTLLTLMALSMMNFSLALITSLILTLPAVLTQPLQERQLLPHVLRILLTVIFSPPVSLLLFSSGYLYFFFPTSFPFPALLVEGASLSLRGMAYAITSWLFHGSWLFPVGCMAVWPLWLMSWTLNWQRGQLSDKQHLD